MISDVVEPARKAAEDGKDLERWSNGTQSPSSSTRRSSSSSSSFASMVFLVATNTEEQWKALNSQLNKTKGTFAEWSTLVKGNTQLEAVAVKLTDLCGL